MYLVSITHDSITLLGKILCDHELNSYFVAPNFKKCTFPEVFPRLTLLVHYVNFIPHISYRQPAFPVLPYLRPVSFLSSTLSRAVSFPTLALSGAASFLTLSLNRAVSFLTLPLSRSVPPTCYTASPAHPLPPAFEQRAHSAFQSHLPMPPFPHSVCSAAIQPN